jgi:beta-glucosidase
VTRDAPVPGFPEGFVWGLATSAYQVEGAVHEDGRGASIWDTFSHTPGAIRGGDTGDRACDQYHRFEEDAALLGELGVGAYRLSVAWPRIQPTGRGPANQRGLDHYRRVVDALRRHGVRPILTLFHWDLPQALQDEGGWPSRDTAERFAEYAAIVGEALAGEVVQWITVNEPMVAAWLGYGRGIHAPGERDTGRALAAAHHQLLAHGGAVAALRAAGAAEIGIALNLYPFRPASDDPADVDAAEVADAHMNRFFLDPVFGRPYPARILDHYAATEDLSFLRDGDLTTIAQPIDFLGVNYYTVQTVTGTLPAEPRDTELPAALGIWSITPPDVEVTSMGWPIQPDGLTEILTRVHREYGPDRIYVTENGAAFDDEVAPDGVHDRDRVAYLQGHVAAIRVAIDAGAPVAGYLAWSFLDNFEWAEGYARRFGVVHVDFETLERTPKDSARWFAAQARGSRRADPPLTGSGGTG